MYMFDSIETNFKESISKFQIPYLVYYIVIYNILCTYYYLCYYIIITYITYYVQNFLMETTVEKNDHNKQIDPSLIKNI